ncbi:MAG: hypothetical protein CVU78_03500 [Elusimicrobia bacterium HGW-Elusimicrobia-2]|nr:MAG: hypothetical protein CVU78_03500 [Elusimicrobia bacterium HGW-Elusimicrobia-2]
MKKYLALKGFQNNKIKIILIALSFFILIIPALAEKSSPQTGAEQYEVYVPTVVIQAKWGTKAGEFGYKIVPAHGEVLHGKEKSKIIVGPTCISVNENGEIYVLDTVNKRVLKYDKQGEFIDAINLELPEDIIYDNYAFQEMYIGKNGHIYLRYTISIGSWFIFNRKGHLVKRIIDKKSAETTMIMFQNAKKDIADAKNDVYGKYAPDKKKEELKWQEKRIKKYEDIYADSKTVLLDWYAEGKMFRTNLQGNIYLGENHKINYGNIKKMTKKQIANIQTETLSEKYKKIRKRIKPLPFKSDDGKEITLYDGLTGEEFVTNAGDIYKIVRSFNPNNFSTVKIIKWTRKK